MVIKDLEVGRGAVLKSAQEFTLNYVALDYKTGERLETAWGPSAFRWVWGLERLVAGMEIGLKGMRVGGLRELIVPSRLAYDSGARIYLLELLKLY